MANLSSMIENNQAENDYTQMSEEILHHVLDNFLNLSTFHINYDRNNGYGKPSDTFSVTSLSIEYLKELYQYWGLDVSKLNEFVDVYLKVFKGCNLITNDNTPFEFGTFCSSSFKHFEFSVNLNNRYGKEAKKGNYYPPVISSIKFVFRAEIKGDTIIPFVHIHLPYGKYAEFKFIVYAHSVVDSDFEAMVKTKAMERIREIINNSKCLNISKAEFKNLSYEDLVNYFNIYHMLDI